MNLNQPNEVELILMKNIREELAVIPVEYVNSITYDMTTYMKLDLQIPNQIKRGGLTLDYPLYNQIKGKQQIILSINGQKSKLIIDDKIDVIETSKGKIKKVYAYGYERSLEKKTFLTGTSITRQLYRKPDEEVEVSEGILNLFEQQTNWKVGYVDEMAQKETHQYNETLTTVLHTSFAIDEVEKDKFFWGRTLKKPIKKGQTFTLHQNGLVAMKDNLIRDKQSFSHTFTAVKEIQSIVARYSSDSTYRFGITYTFNYTDGTSDAFKAPFTNVLGFKVTIESIECAVQTGEFIEKLVTRYRYFEQTSTHWYPFLMSEVAEAFDCVFVFDNYNQIVHCYHKDNFGGDSGLYMSFENGIKEINKTHQIGNIVTRLYVESPNVMISEENKLGTEYVECFDFYKREGLMSDELVTALDRYDALLDEKQVEWLKVKLEKSKADQLLVEKQTQLTKAQERYKVENGILAAYVKEAENISKEKQQEQSLLVKQIDREIQTLLKEINGTNGLKAKVEACQTQMVQIGEAIQKQNARDKQGKIFTDLDLEELEEYVIEGSIENDYYLTAYALYQHALEKIQDMNDVAIDFSITVENLLRKIIHPQGWQSVLGIGERIYLDDLEIRDERGFIQLTGFTFNPNKFEISQLKFTNNKEPKSDIKTIGDIARKTAATSHMTNYWKDVWKDAQTNNVHVSEMLKNGLDAAAMAVRARNSVNKIDITEAGIFIQDAEKPENQVALMSGLIAITEDGWETSKTAISAEGVVAETIIGRLLLGDKLLIGNEDNTFVINPGGLSVYDPKSTQEERIFLGIRDGKAQLRLYSSKGDKNLVLSEDGLFNVIPISAMDNFDKDHPLECNFYIGSNIKSVHEFNLRVKLSKFRGYTKGAASTKTSTTLTTTNTTGGSAYTSTSKTNVIQTVRSTSKATTDLPSSFATSKPTLIDSSVEDNATNFLLHHQHVLDDEAWKNHRHEVEMEIDPHSHAFELPSHRHDFDLIIEGHSHDMAYGIYEYSGSPTVNIYLDDTLIASNVTTNKTYDLTSKVSSLGNGWHTIKVVGVSKTNNPSGLGRCSIDAYLGAFVSF